MNISVRLDYNIGKLLHRAVFEKDFWYII